MKEQPQAFCISWRQAGAKITHHRRGDDSMDGDFRGGGSLAEMHRHSAASPLQVTVQCMMHIGKTEMAVKETWEIQKVAKWCMRAERSVPWQITCLSEGQHMPGLVWSSAHVVWPARMRALTVHLEGQLESQHSDGVTGFAWGEEEALIKSLFSLPRHLFLQNS